VPRCDELGPWLRIMWQIAELFKAKFDPSSPLTPEEVELA
jgi:hypothetical protein